MIMEVAKGDLRAFMRKHVHWGITNLHKKNVASLTTRSLIHSLPTTLHCLPTARYLIHSLRTAHCSSRTAHRCPLAYLLAAHLLIRLLHQVELSFERNEWRLKPRALDEASAATKIQAGFRGKAGRRRHNKVLHDGGVGAVYLCIGRSMHCSSVAFKVAASHILQQCCTHSSIIALTASLH